LLDSSRSVPAVPVSSARGGVREDPVLPLAVVTTNWLLCEHHKTLYSLYILYSKCVKLTAHHSSAIRTANSMGIIAVSDESSLVSGKCQTIRTGLDHCLSTGVAFIVVVAVLFVRKHSIVFISAKILSRLSSAYRRPKSGKCVQEVSAACTHRTPHRNLQVRVSTRNLQQGPPSGRSDDATRRPSTSRLRSPAGLATSNGSSSASRPPELGPNRSRNRSPNLVRVGRQTGSARSCDMCGPDVSFEGSQAREPRSRRG